jgi:hypothetical protein
MNEQPWLVLILSLPTENATVRMRAWRTLKASGAAVLRDGVYLLPCQSDSSALFEGVAEDVQSSGGTAFILHAADDEQANFPALFDRADDYSALVTELAQLQASFTADALPSLTKQLRKLRKNFAAITTIDFFSNQAQVQTQEALTNAELQLNRLLSPDEPHETTGNIQRLDVSQYQNQTWATRKRPWVDRLASAWLIRRFIDKNARILWLDSPAECPADALGFDFDGARFTHLEDKVSFEVLVASFALEQPALNRFGAVVHYLDAGGIEPNEANGLEQILWGLRNSISDDDQLLAAASSVFDALLTAFTEKV